MNIEEIQDHCIRKPGVTEEFPFDDVTLVFKVDGKMFVLVPLERELSLSLKCDPELAWQLRERYAAVHAAFHMSKTHWNTIHVDGSIPDKLIYRWIDHSYDLVKEKASRKKMKKKK
jgi:predicted DNA-binding protein (MmcQ/YjbR family)